RALSAPLTITLYCETRRGVGDVTNLLKGRKVRLPAAGQMELVITSAVQENGPLHPRTSWRGREFNPGAVAYIRHGVVSVVSLRQLGQQVSVAVIPGLLWTDLLHNRRLVGAVINGKRVERPEAHWRADPYA